MYFLVLISFKRLLNTLTLPLLASQRNNFNKLPLQMSLPQLIRQPTFEEVEMAACIYGRYLTISANISFVFGGSFAFQLLSGDGSRLPPPTRLQIIIAASPREIHQLQRPFYNRSEPYLGFTPNGLPVVIIQPYQHNSTGVIVDFLSSGQNGFPFLLMDCNATEEPTVTHIERNGIQFPILRPRFLLFQQLLLVNSMTSDHQRSLAMAEIQVLLDCAVCDGGRFSPREAEEVLPVVVALFDFAERHGVLITRDHLEMWMELGIDLTNQVAGLDNWQSQWRQLLCFMFCDI